MSRNPARNQVAGAFYHVRDMTSTEQVRTHLDKVRPSTIIHTASPIATGKAEKWQYWYRTNVGGTKNDLDCAAASTYVKAFVYTSSVLVIDKSPYDYLDETPPMATSTSKLNYDSKPKALADHYVLDSNNKTGLRTTCLRIPSIYGPRDNQLIPGAIQALRAGLQRKQIGGTTNLYNTFSIQNAATAHVLAAKALLSDQKYPLLKVDGEAFFITEGHSIPFWDFLRMIWVAAGDKPSLEEIQVIPV